jgi:phosphotransferase system HPr-like phosphotransfer protein
MKTRIQVTAPRGLHLRPSQILEKEIQEIKGDVYLIKDKFRKKIKQVKDILSLEVAQGDFIDIQVFPNCKHSIEKIRNKILEINSIIFT